MLASNIARFAYWFKKVPKVVAKRYLKSFNTPKWQKKSGDPETQLFATGLSVAEQLKCDSIGSTVGQPYYGSLLFQPRDLYVDKPAYLDLYGSISNKRSET